MEPFYSVSNIPVHSVMLMETAQEAINFPKRDLKLAFCHHCGFIHNAIFDPEIQEYNAKCEETQGFSDTFNKFHRTLAERLIEKHELYHKTVLEIGCGKGEFIAMLCELGDNVGYGFDPAFVPERNPDKFGKVEFVQDLYSEKYSHYKADFVCCKMTLEHIPNTLEFMKVVRAAIGENLDTIVFFQIPEAGRVLKDLGFWDVYYEHCSYFSPASLEYLFRRAGFEVLEIATEYDDQYLTIEAKPAEVAESDEDIDINTLEIKELFDLYKSNIEDLLNRWKSLLNSYFEKGFKIVVWGGGSKAVAFMTTLNIGQQINYVVDINPYKQNHFLPGTGQMVVSPEFLAEYRPDVVLLMNPIYEQEINRDLNKLGLKPEILPIDFLSKEHQEFEK